MRKTQKERTDAAFEILVQVFIWAWVLLLTVAAGLGVTALIGAAVGR